ncbi:phage tail protein [Herbaspirillum sp. alder98]|uniref:phage tail protein n=1 Tax=Herbaspirillum sp. alder98 TaxID=2913096 RepID=UPI001CD8F70A|nr:tail fiber protein [Herbaspirillum sp. alder98]MCA1326901.1 tail fiber protein [Herbaspirillum sp. alder98]
MFAFSKAPSKWLLCDGSMLKISEYQDLFMLLGTSYGGDGAETFQLPDMRGRVPLHQGQGVSATGNLSKRVLGRWGGLEKVTLDSAHIPVHSHGFWVSSDLADNTSPDGRLLARGDNENLYVAPAKIGSAVSGVTATATTSAAGGSKAHENMMPTLTVSYCICADGFFPPRA